MASIKISELESVTSLTESDALPIVNGNETKKVTIEKLGDILATKDYVTETLGEIGSTGFTPIIVETLPTTNISTSTVYLVLNKQQADKNIYDEYIYVGEKWEIVGSTAVDLSNYYTKTEVDNMMSGGGTTQEIREYQGITPIYKAPIEIKDSGSDSYLLSAAQLTVVQTEVQKAYDNGDLFFILSLCNTYIDSPVRKIDVFLRRTETATSFTIENGYDNMVYTKATSFRLPYVYNFSNKISNGVVTVSSVGISQMLWNDEVTPGIVSSGHSGITQNVLGMGNTKEYTPTADYHPATKKYVDDAVANIDIPESGGSVDTSNIQEFPTIDLTDYISYTETGQYIDITDAGKTKLSELFTNYYKRHNTLAGLNFTIISRKYNPRGFKMLMLYRDELSAGNVYFYQIVFPADLDISNMSYTSNMNFNYTVSEDGTVTIGRMGAWGSNFTNGLSTGRIKDYVLTKSNTTSFTPTGDYHPATKKYVDDAIAAIEIPEGGGETSSNPAIYFLDLGISGFQFVDYTWVSGTSETGVKLYELLNKVISDGNEENFILVVSNSIATHKRYILTLSPESDKLSTGGSIKFSGTQFWNDSKGVLKYYVCALTFTAKLTDGVLTSGGSITAWTTNSQLLPTDNITVYTPSSDYHPATKKYVDDAVANAGGGAETGFVLNGSPVFKIGCNYIHQLEVGRTYSGYINADDAIAMYKYCVENGVEYPAINLSMNSSNAEFTGIGISRTEVVDITGSSTIMGIYGLSSSDPNKYWYMDLRISCDADGNYTLGNSTSIKFSQYTGATTTYVDNAISTAITTVLEAEY